MYAEKDAIHPIHYLRSTAGAQVMPQRSRREAKYRSSYARVSEKEAVIRVLRRSRDMMPSFVRRLRDQRSARARASGSSGDAARCRAARRALLVLQRARYAMIARLICRYADVCCGAQVAARYAR